MEASIAVLGGFQSLLDNLVLAQLIILDCLVDSNDVLPDDTAGTNVQMADLGVAHQALRKANREGRCLQLGEPSGAFGEIVHDRSLSGSNRIAILGGLVRRDTPAVNHDYTTGESSESATQAQGI